MKHTSSLQYAQFLGSETLLWRTSIINCYEDNTRNPKPTEYNHPQQLDKAIAEAEERLQQKVEKICKEKNLPREKVMYQKDVIPTETHRVFVHITAFLEHNYKPE